LHFAFGTRGLPADLEPLKIGEWFSSRFGWLCAPQSVILAFGMRMRADKIISEARAKIIWGEESSAVREFLISNGVSVRVAEAKLKEFERERSHKRYRALESATLDVPAFTRTIQIISS
jgi:hypothetical protein